MVKIERKIYFSLIREREKDKIKKKMKKSKTKNQLDYKKQLIFFLFIEII